MRGDRAYRCSVCHRWIPREGHADWCSRTRPAANDNHPLSRGVLHSVASAVHTALHQETAGHPLRNPGRPLPPHRARPAESNDMGTNEEVKVRLAAARTWLDHALAGDCDASDAIDAAEGLCEAARAYVEGRA